ncbi:MAG: hemerythrin domain-containing protein [Pseudomonadota bacterium]|nr:hemerythrin domain-containing protein [Pseudomonadota bacterium]
MPDLDIYAALRESHDIQRELCTRLTRTRNPEGRLETFRTLKLELYAHAAAEERFLYAPMLMEDAGLYSARHALAEHHRLDHAVEALQGLPADGDDFGAAAKRLVHGVRHHLKEEERRFFQVSGRILTETQKRKLARQYLRDYARMKKHLAAQWGWTPARATHTDTPAVKQARKTVPARSGPERVAGLVQGITTAR